MAAHGTLQGRGHIGSRWWVRRFPLLRIPVADEGKKGEVDGFKQRYFLFSQKGEVFWRYEGVGLGFHGRRFT